MMIDTHCHLNDADAFPDAQSVFEEARAAGVGRVIVVGVDTESSKRALELADRFESAFAIVGWHPNYTAKYSSAELVQIAALLEHPKAVAIGEIGLDFHWSYATREDQERALFEQFELAETSGKPIVFHCREAYPALLTILEDRPVMPYLFHCFAGNAEDLSRANALDAYFGIDGPITYKKSTELRELVRAMPKERIVIETDSPYLSPEPFRGKPNKPANIPHINNALAMALGISNEECAALTTANATQFFHLPPI